ncbi:unnamed protein product, partial [marine sediment metagenome]
SALAHLCGSVDILMVQCNPFVIQHRSQYMALVGFLF